MTPTHMRKLLNIAIFVVMLLGSIDLSNATAEDARCNQLQLLFLIDQSGSMNGVGTTRVNDPNELRFAAPRRAVEDLIDRHIRLYPDDEYQFAIVHFGNFPQLGLDWTTITATTSDEGQMFMDGIADQFTQQSLGAASLGDTNVKAAFEYAASMFSRLDNGQPYSGGCPQRAIILLTDGKPEGEFVTTGTAQHMTELGTYLTANMSIPPYRLYVVAMNDSSRDYWTEMESYWRDIAGDNSRIGLVLNQEEVGRRFREILDELLGEGPGTDICTGSLIIPPYLQWLSITFYKPAEASEHLTISDANGVIDSTRQDMAVSLSGEDTAIETVRIENPTPGLWNIGTTTAEARCGLEQQTIFAVGKLSYPDPTQTVIQFTQVQVEFRLTDSQGGDLPDYQNSLYDLDVMADLQKVGTTNVAGAQPLVAFEPGDVPNMYQGTCIPIEVGVYEVVIEGYAEDAQGDEVEVIPPGTSIGNFIVASPQLVQIAKPDGMVLPQYSPITYTLAIQDIDQQSITLDYPNEFQVQVTQSGQSVPITTAFDEATKEFTFSFTPDNAGQYEIAYWCEVTPPGQQPVIFGREDITLDIYPTARLNVNFLTPPPDDDNLVVTDYLNRPDQMRVEFQLTKIEDDNQETPISPDQIVTGNANNLFSITVEDQFGEDVSDRFRLGRTAITGGYELIGDEIPVGSYKILIQPIQEVKATFVWGQDTWIRDINAINDVRFYYILAGAIAISILIILCAVEWLMRLFHPASGTFHVYEMVTDSYTGDMDRRFWMSENLHRNFHRYMMGIRWKLPCMLPKFYFYRMPSRIRRIEVRCLSAADSAEGRITVEAWGKTKKSHNKVRLGKGSVDQPLLEGYLIAKDPPPDWRN